MAFLSKSITTCTSCAPLALCEVSQHLSAPDSSFEDLPHSSAPATGSNVRKRDREDGDVLEEPEQKRPALAPPTWKCKEKKHIRVHTCEGFKKDVHVTEVRGQLKNLHATYRDAHKYNSPIYHYYGFSEVRNAELGVNPYCWGNEEIPEDTTLAKILVEFFWEYVSQNITGAEVFPGDTKKIKNNRNRINKNISNYKENARKSSDCTFPYHYKTE